MTNVRCCLCGRHALAWANDRGFPFFPEFYCFMGTRCESLDNCFHPLCDECTLSAGAQHALLFPTDMDRVLDGVGL